MAKNGHLKKIKTPLLLALWSTLFLLPLWLTIGRNGVGDTYWEGTTRFWNGENPYAPGVIADVFQYSPLFAFLYGPMLWLPNFLQSILWTLLNAFVFWWGVCRWFEFDWKMSKWWWAVWVLASMELDISLRYHQINASLVGSILIALDLYRKQHFTASASVLALGTNIKILPVVFAGALLWPVRRNYALALVVATGAFLFIPALARGWDGNLHLLLSQYQSLSSDLAGRSITDLRTVIERLGYPGLGEFLRIVVAITTVIIFGSSRLLFKDKQFPWELWISLGLLALLLLNPRTESPTFVLAAPVYLFLLHQLKGRARWIVLVAAFTITVNYTSVWPESIPFPFHHLYGAKSLGCFLLWMICVGLLGRRLSEAFQHLKLKKSSRSVAIGNR